MEGPGTNEGSEEMIVLGTGVVLPGASLIICGPRQGQHTHSGQLLARDLTKLSRP